MFENVKCFCKLKEFKYYNRVNLYLGVLRYPTGMKLMNKKYK